MTDPEIKNLLGRALGDEPPLGIDRDEVFRRGRKRLRTRRTFEAGGVVAAVVVAAVGAVMLTGLVGEPEKLPPAASTTAERPAPPGPTLPVTPPTTESSPPSAPPSSVTHEPATPDRARELTDTVKKSKLVDLASASPVPGMPDRTEFVIDSGVYMLEADLQSAEGKGWLALSVHLSGPEAATGCNNLPNGYACEVRAAHGIPVVLGTWKDRATGEKRYAAYAFRPEGVTVSGMVTNLTERDRQTGQRPASRSPVLDQETLIELVTLPGLTY